MLGLGKPKPVAEHEASGETERIFHEIRQTLRVSGISLIFRTWAGAGRLLPIVWDALRPNLESRAFEDAADALRGEAVREAVELGRVAAAAPLGQSQSFQLRAALDLYRYVTPKLLLVTSAVRLALEGEEIGGAGRAGERISRGIPERMYPMEMVPEDPDEPRLRELFADIRETLGLSQVNSLYRTLALWPDCLEPAWGGLKPITRRPEYAQAADRLRARSRDAVRRLPYPVPLSLETVQAAGEDATELARTAEDFEALIPGIILDVALFSLDWHGADEAARSPFPAASRAAGGAG